MCKAVGKNFADYKRLQSTEAFLQELSSVVGIPITGLVYSFQGGRPQDQGTWVHPDVAINLGQWCSPKFAVAVSRWVRDWMAGKFTKGTLPYRQRRRRHEAGMSYSEQCEACGGAIVDDRCIDCGKIYAD
jgi:hypothetical protein